MLRRLVTQAGSCDEAVAAATAAAPRETGGILTGYRAGDDVFVERAIEIRDFSATSSSYRRKHATAQEALEAELKSAAAASHIGYVGEWHSHPAARAASDQDIREIVDISKASPSPVALLVLKSDAHGRWALSAWIASGGVADAVEVVSTGS